MMRKRIQPQQLGEYLLIEVEDSERYSHYVQLRNQSDGFLYPHENLRNKRLFVLYDVHGLRDQEPIAAICITNSNWIERNSYETTVVVARERRRQGISTILKLWCFDYLASEGVQQVFAVVNKKNEANIAALKKLGCVMYRRGGEEDVYVKYLH